MAQEITTNQQAGDIIQPATSGDIKYRAFGRPYAGSDSQVITLLASCSYPVGGYQIFFTREYGPDEVYVLNEKKPGIFYNIVSYYAADYCSQVGLATPVEYVTIKDAHGAHQVPVEPI